MSTARWRSGRSPRIAPRSRATRHGRDPGVRRRPHRDRAARAAPPDARRPPAGGTGLCRQPDGGRGARRVSRRVLERRGMVVIPAFAVDRTEIVLLALRRLMRDGRLPAVPVYVDSPMAVGALAAYRAAFSSDAAWS